MAMMQSPSGDSPCPTGQAIVYEYRFPEGSDTPVSYPVGPGGASMTQTCQPSPCSAAEVGVDIPTRDLTGRNGPTIVSTIAGGIACVSPPPVCPPGQYAAYVPPSATTPVPIVGGWHCTGSCDVIIEYGAEYGGLEGNRVVCAPAPPTCAAGQVATFRATDETWACTKPCDASYDITTYESTLICVPC
jgi:hypothetical protein